MSTIGAVALLALVAVAGIVLVLSGWWQPAPTLARTVQHLQRRGPAVVGEHDLRSSRVSAAPPGPVLRLARSLLGALGDGSRVLPSEVQLRVVGRTAEQHVVYLVAAAAAGFLGPTVLVGVAQRVGLLGLGWYAPVLVALAGAVFGPLIVHAVTIEQAEAIRSDMRYQVSAYLDVVTMLLAGNTGYEGALDQAARAGDGRLFAELRRRMREAGARGSSLTEALHRTGSDLGLDELEQIAATAALSAAEGAPVARTLAAKCATLRSALASEHETEARLRTSRLTAPIVGMALIFMALVMYPALTFS